MEDVLKAISTVGFPIAVAMYLLIRIEPKLTALTDVVKELITTVGAVTKNTDDMIEVVRTDADNTKDMKIAVTNFTISINDLKNEISKINNKR